MPRRYVTTAIDYPNAAPHMGHVLEKVLADVAARWFRLRGDEVRFQIGTDEHGIKIQRTAETEGVSPQELVDRNVPKFQELYDQLQISYDHFIRTSDKQEHWPTVEALWNKLQEAGKLEKRSYTGLYCAGCERFLTKRDLEDGKCPVHKVEPDEVIEENWFFTLSQDAKWLKELLTRDDGYRIVPEFRAKETLSLIDQGLEDVSFSRPRSSLAWGIPVPGDEDHVMYVWCDALTNYISGLDYFGLDEDEEVYHERAVRARTASRLPAGRQEWWDGAEVTHVIGKDITRFHALIWPAMLKAAGIKIPERLLVHGFLTSEGEKMSKSLGNVVVPQDVIEKYGVDALRFYLSHEVPVGRDGDFSWERFGQIYDGVLRNNLGNLLNRVLILLKKEDGSLLPVSDFDFSETWRVYDNSMNTFDLKAAIEQAIAFAAEGNQAMDKLKPWTLEGEEKVKTLSSIAEFLRHAALMLLPFMPETAQKISRQLGVPYADRMLEADFLITEEMKQWGSQTDWKQIGEPAILFPPIED